MERKELEGVFLVKPRALEVKEPYPREAGKGKRVDCELVNALLFGCRGFVVEDMDRPVSHLHDVDVAGDKLPVGEVHGYAEPQHGLIMEKVVGGKKNRYLNGNGDGIIDEEELLDGLVAQCVVAHRLGDQPGRAHRGILLGDDFDRIHIKYLAVLRSAQLTFPEDFMRALGNDELQELLQGSEFCVPELLLQDEVGFGAVVAKVVDLAVEELGFHKNFAAVIVLLDKRPKPQEREVLGKALEPVGDVLRTYGQTIVIAHAFGRFREGVEPVIQREAGKNNVDRERPAAGEKRRELPAAPVAVPQLHGLQFFLSRAFADNLTPAAERAAGYGFALNCSIFSHACLRLRIFLR